MENTYLRTVEINGVKIEVDLRTAKRVDSFKIGDAVKLLIKEYSDSYTSYPATIVGFDEFVNRPTIIVAYIKIGYSETSLHFAYINKDNNDKYEIAPANEFECKAKKADAIDYFEREISKKKKEVEDLELRKTYFINNYNNYFKWFEEKTA